MQKVCVDLGEVLAKIQKPILTLKTACDQIVSLCTWVLVAEVEVQSILGNFF